MLIKFVAEEPHRCLAHAHRLEARFDADRADVPVGFEQIVNGHDRSAV